MRATGDFGEVWFVTGSQELYGEHVLEQVAAQSIDGRPNLVTSAECWLMTGGPHHTVLSTALDREALADFADMAGVKLLLIDEATGTRSFAKEIRSNNTYYRLAQRL
jgi:L-arabinose isomerase